MSAFVLIAAVIIFILVRFFSDWKKQSLKIQSEGGVLKKYAILIGYLEAEESPQVFKLDSEMYSFGWITPNADNRFNVIESFGSVVVKWDFKASIPFSERIVLHREWRYKEDCNQELAAKKILKEISELYSKHLGGEDFFGDEIPIPNDFNQDIDIVEIEKPVNKSFTIQEIVYEIDFTNPDANSMDFMIKTNPNVVNEVDGFGETLLHHVASSKNTSLIELLIKKGADVNAIGMNGETPIYRAVQNKNVENVLCLVNNGAKVRTGNMERETPIAVAEQYGCNGKIYDMLSQKMEFDNEYVSSSFNEKMFTPESNEKFKTAVKGMNNKMGGGLSFEAMIKAFDRDGTSKKYFNAIVKGWELNSFPKQDYETIFSKLFFRYIPTNSTDNIKEI